MKVGVCVHLFWLAYCLDDFGCVDTGGRSGTRVRVHMKPCVCTHMKEFCACVNMKKSCVCFKKSCLHMKEWGLSMELCCVI